MLIYISLTPATLTINTIFSVINTRYGFFLGAGASVESGIPVAKALSEKWLRTIKNNKGANNRELSLGECYY
jgi:NAD-dependent SIR2 family protein deacetylase